MIDFRHYIDYDYETERDCFGSGCDSICRCARIVNPVINSISISSMADAINKKLRKSGTVTASRRDKKISKILGSKDHKIVDEYCFHRILTHLHAWSPDNYEFDIKKSYYGEEVFGLDFFDSNSLSTHCHSIYCMESVNDKIRYVLNLEYGNVPFDSSDFELIEIDKTNIVLTNEKHWDSVSKKELDFYSNDQYGLPRGIVLFDGDKYSIIDGYHRIFASSSKMKVYNLIK